MAHVYFIQAVIGGPIKIGYSGDAVVRLSALQEGCPFELVILCVAPGDRRAEFKIHKRFAADNIGGEWFSPSSDLAAYIRELGGTVFQARAWTMEDRAPRRSRALIGRASKQRVSVYVQEYARERLRQECAEPGMATRVSRTTGFSKPQISNVIKWRQGPGESLVIALAAHWDMTLEQLEEAAHSSGSAVPAPAPSA